MIAAPLNNGQERELTIIRIFDAPRDLVFQAWTDPKHLAHWWGPKGFTLPVCTMDFRQGGAYRVCMRSPEGRDYWVRGIYHEIQPPSRIVFSWAHENEDGTLDHETQVTVTFGEHGRKTELTLKQAVFESDASRDEHQGGWTDSIESLAAYVVSLTAAA